MHKVSTHIMECTVTTCSNHLNVAVADSSPFGPVNKVKLWRWNDGSFVHDKSVHSQSHYILSARGAFLNCDAADTSVNGEFKKH